MPSLRKRLLIGTASGTAAILLIAGVTLYTTMRAALYEKFDEALYEKSQTFASMIESDGDQIELEFAEANIAEFSRQENPEYYQVWSDEGTTIAMSPSLHQSDLITHPVIIDRPEFRNIVLKDGRPGRVVMLKCSPRIDSNSGATTPPLNLVVALARDVLDVRATLASLRVVLIVIGVVATLTSLGLLSWLVNVGLRPTQRLAGQIGKLDECRLSDRIDLADAPFEIQPIAQRLNELLERLERAFVREKTLTANVAHELRTPLAGLRATLEVVAARDRDPEAYRHAINNCHVICRETQTLVDNLLAMARLDARCETMRRESTSVHQLLRDSWQPFEELAAQRNLERLWNIDDPLVADTDPDLLQRVFSNVFENAVQYVDTGGTITVRAHRPNRQLQVEVTNTGCQISRGDMSRVFDRFWRGDAARRADGHAGLGLPLCRQIVEHLGGRMTARLIDDSTFSIVMTLEG